MSLVNNFLRHRFLIERLRMAAHSLGDFEDDLAHSGEYAEVKSFSKRTLQRDMKDIREIYHIDIQYNKSIKKYEIVEDNDLYAQNLFEAFDVFRALQNHGNLSKLIAFDHRYPKGTSHPAGPNISLLCYKLSSKGSNYNCTTTSFGVAKRYKYALLNLICSRNHNTDGMYWPWMWIRKPLEYLVLIVLGLLRIGG